jgi:hypothetical protein
LLEHIRRRTGLLLERRPGVFAFAHLTFQEYLAAQAIHEGNRSAIDIERLVREHNDGRWKEVIALYCGLATAPSARSIIERLISCENTQSLSAVIAEAYLSSEAKFSGDTNFRRRVLERLAIAPGSYPSSLARFPTEDVAPIANGAVGRLSGGYLGITEAHRWLYENFRALNKADLFHRLKKWQTMGPLELGELIHLAHCYGPERSLMNLSRSSEIYRAPGPNFSFGRVYASQAEVALAGISRRISSKPFTLAAAFALRQILRTLAVADELGEELPSQIISLLNNRPARLVPQDSKLRLECAALARKLTELIAKAKGPMQKEAASGLNSWADSLERGNPVKAREGRGG